MPQLHRMVLCAALLAPAVLTAQSRQTERDAFTLSERVPQGQWIRVRNLNGEMRVRASATDKVEISATRSWRRGNPKDVRIESRTSRDGSILVCAMWTDDTECTETGYSSHGDRNRRCVQESGRGWPKPSRLGHRKSEAARPLEMLDRGPAHPAFPGITLENRAVGAS